jgi:hypothetical protein
LPNLYLSFVRRVEGGLKLDQVYEFPLFGSTLREKLLLRVGLKVSGSVTDCIIAGTALVLN